MKDQLLIAADVAERYRDAMLAGLTAEQWTQQPPDLPMHPASIVGHVAAVYGFVAGMMEGKAPALPQGWPQSMAHSAQCQPDTAYPPKDELLSVLKCARGRVIEALRKATPEDLARPIEHPRLKAIFPTVGALAISSLTVHDATHNGQLSSWRRAMGMELPI
ncbi:MAG: DinB family protein [Phycisphaerae bacterium]